MIEEQTICKLCGKCCMTLKQVGRFYVELEPCKYLDKRTNECTVYEDRLGQKLNKGNVCVTAKESVQRRLHPKECPYVKHYLGNKRYRPLVKKVVKNGKNN